MGAMLRWGLDGQYTTKLASSNAPRKSKDGCADSAPAIGYTVHAGSLRCWTK